MNWFSGFGTDTTGAFSGVADNLSGKSALGVSKGGGMGPLAFGLGLANIGAGLFGGMSSAQAQKEATNAAIANQVAAANFSAQQQANAQALQAATGMLGMQFGEYVAAPAEFRRQKEAALFKAGPLRALERAGETKDWQRAMDRAVSGPAKEAARFANRQALKQKLAESQGAMVGMFGPIAPINVDAMFIG